MSTIELRMKLSGRVPFLFVMGVYFLASLVTGPVEPEAVAGVPHLRLGPFVVGRPMVLSGDSPHYLVAVNSLVEDGDFDLRNNYDQAFQGDWDMGARFRGRDIDRHVDTDTLGRQYGTHSPFFALLLSVFASPFAGTQWVAAVCIWLTLAAGLGGVYLFGWWRTDRSWDRQPELDLCLLALATPLLCYCRDIWTEPWILLIWMAMLVSGNLAVLAILAFLGTLIKYPFVVVPLTMGVTALYNRQRVRALVLFSSAAVGILVVVGTIQYIFQNVDHFSLFHSGRHRSFDWPFDGLLGLLGSPNAGLLVFFPFLTWGLWSFAKARSPYLPALVFLLVHASYQDWRAGTGFSARYLVPMLPLLTAGAMDFAPGNTVFRIAVLYSLFWGVFGGVLPAIVYGRSPWEVVLHVLKHL